MDRPTWDEYFMLVAGAIARRSTCDRAIVGAVLVKDNHIVSTGYNGSPSGLPHCGEENHLMENGHCVRTIHAEVNAVIQAAIQGSMPSGTTCYVTHFPCFQCAKVLANARINEIVYDVPYRIDPRSLETFAAAKIIVRRIGQEA